ncbi:hypothetical protein GQ602_003346 [Ophiocordyceps camponoti-floridani]|uniref:Uncharacterized protein n=1 Tax=Ophiocordyceps camponoti-floridani TaxID=2030778 RepID=A0A8H4VEF0_9HYPO|nr:hypothetical protein GQ602_003346 [Ophiocordyceps camponoti-floridani]
MCHRTSFICQGCNRGRTVRVQRCALWKNHHHMDIARRAREIDDPKWCPDATRDWVEEGRDDMCKYFCQSRIDKMWRIYHACQAAKAAKAAAKDAGEEEEEAAAQEEEAGEVEAQSEANIDPVVDFDSELRLSLDSMSEAQHRIWVSKRPRARIQRAKAACKRVIARVFCLRRSS